MPTHPTVFRDPEGEAEYLEAYQTALSRWPVPFEELTIPTRLGPAHVVASGPLQAPPLVLLPSTNQAAVSWAEVMPCLSAARRVYAPDIVNDLGKSALARVVQGQRDYTAWLSDLFEGLKLVEAPVVGCGFGSWLAMSLALHHPKRAGKLVLVSPGACFSPYPLIYFYRAWLANTRPTPERAERLLRWLSGEGSEVDEGQARDFLFRLKLYRPPTRVLASVFTDEELRQIKSPALVLAGERETLFRPQKAIDRARRLMPDARGEIIPGAGHLVLSQKPKELSERILRFLNEVPGNSC